MLRTILEQFVNYPDVDTLAPDEHLATTTPAGAVDIRNDFAKQNKRHYECIVLGGGQSGLSTGGRLKALNVDYLVVEKQQDVGDSWKSRYDVARRR